MVTRPDSQAPTAPSRASLCIVLVACDARDVAALATALERMGADVTHTTPADAVEHVRFEAPELVVACTAATELRAALAADPSTRVIAIVEADDSPDVDRSAQRLVGLARSLADRTGRGPRAAIALATSSSVAERIDRALAVDASGLLSARADDGRGGVLIAGPHHATSGLPRLIAALEPLAAQGKSVAVAFLEAPPGSLRAIPNARRDATGATLEGARVVLLGTTGAAPEGLTLSLEVEGATVATMESGGASVGRARTLAPDVILADESVLDDLRGPATSAIRADPRLAWAAVLAVPRELFLARRRTEIALEPLVYGIDDLLAPDAAITAQVLRGDSFHVRLESTGPLRLLRALVRSTAHVRATVVHARATVHVEINEGIVLGARAVGMQGETAQGHSALATFFALPSGRVRIERWAGTRLFDVMSPLDEALVAALRERSRVRLSTPADPEREAPIVVPASEVVALLEKRLLGPSDTIPTVPPRGVPEPGPHFATTKRESPAVPPPGAMAPLAASARPVALPTPVPVAPPMAPRPRGLMPVALVVGVAALAVIAWLARPAPPTPRQDPALAAAFDEVEVEAAPDVAEETAAEDARAAAPRPSTGAGSAATTEISRLDGATIDAMIQRGNFARHHGDLDLAIRYYRDVLASDPTNARALVGLARCHEMRGHLGEATRYARILRESHADHPANYVLLGDLLLSSGDRAGAREQYQAAADLFPNNVPSHERLAAMER